MVGIWPGEVCALPGEKSNEPDVYGLALEVAALKNDVKNLISEIGRLREHVDKGFERRESSVDKLLVALEARIQEKIDGINSKLDNYTTLDSFKPVTKWLTIIGASVITFVLTMITMIISFILNYIQNGKPPTTGLDG